MRRRVHPFAYFYLAAVLAWALWLVVDAFAQDGQRVDPAQLVVVDADTFDYGATRYRLAGADAPELARPACDAERRLARHAKAYVEALFAAAGEVRLAPTGRSQPATARYRARLEARVYVDDADLAELLVAADFARPEGARGRWCNGL